MWFSFMMKSTLYLYEVHKKYKRMFDTHRAQANLTAIKLR